MDISPGRSGCPINLTLEVIGDRWSLIIIRDIMFGNRRHYRELLSASEERIASNILANRLKRLVALGILSRRDDPSHRQKAVYSLTDRGIDLVPLLVEMGAWGRRHLPTTPALAIRQQVMEEGGPALVGDFMAELRHLHLGAPLPPGHCPVLPRLTAAFERVAARSVRPAP
ncbi:transcriptional regulator [Sphingomonas sp. Root50]|nr:helix-turn-helix domain-containing protein [Sphingomonas sp. Root50]KQX21738.1 transcriptional regulator [Sphingomonas sp. Root1294]KQY73053.1 transcriptional regulator [Sphingomonas sp. Root50]KRB88410.1 transcriptional regulator [Sphingomonas sp. Root720]